MKMIAAAAPLSVASLNSLTISFRESDAIGKAIIFVLIAMSIVAWSIMISKWMELKKSLRRTRDFQASYARQDHPFALFASRTRLAVSPLAAIYTAAAREAAFIARDAAGLPALTAESLADLTRFRFSAAQLDILRALGCGAYQGYLFSRPVDATAFADLPCFGRPAKAREQRAG